MMIAAKILVDQGYSYIKIAAILNVELCDVIQGVGNIPTKALYTQIKEYSNELARIKIENSREDFPECYSLHFSEGYCQGFLEALSCIIDFLTKKSYTDAQIGELLDLDLEIIKNLREL